MGGCRAVNGKGPYLGHARRRLVTCRGRRPQCGAGIGCCGGMSSAVQLNLHIVLAHADGGWCCLVGPGLSIRRMRQECLGRGCVRGILCVSAPG